MDKFIAIYDQIEKMAAEMEQGRDINHYHQNKRMKKKIEFFKSKLTGYIAKSIVEEAFNLSGYQTYPFGYESTFSSLIHQLRESKDDTSMRIRTMPDIVVFNPMDRSTAMLEVKYSTSNRIDSVVMSKYKLDDYKKCWQDAYVVYVVLDDVGLYAQKVSAIKVNSDKCYKMNGQLIYYLNLQKNFQPLYDVFPAVKKEVIELLKPIIKNVSNVRSE